MLDSKSKYAYGSLIKLGERVPLQNYEALLALCDEKVLHILQDHTGDQSNKPLILAPANHFTTSPSELFPPSSLFSGWNILERTGIAFI